MTSKHTHNPNDYIHVRSIPLAKIDSNHYIEEFELSYEDIENLSIDKASPSAPFTLQGGNYTIVENYLFDFWTSIIGKDAVLTYMHIKRHSYNSDIANVSLKDLCMYMNVGSINTIKKYVATLERYGFVIMFHRFKKNAEKVKDNKNEVGVIFKLRQSIPLLTIEQVASLPKRLQDKHDKFIEKYNATVTEEEQVKELPSASDILSALIKQNNPSTNHSQNQIVKEVEKVGSLSFAKRLLSVDEEFDEKIKAYIREDESISKPTFEVVYENAVFVRQGLNISVITLDKFHAETIVRKDYMLRSICSKLIPNIHSESIVFRGYTFKELLVELTNF